MLNILIDHNFFIQHKWQNTKELFNELENSIHLIKDIHYTPNMFPILFYALRIQQWTTQPSWSLYASRKISQ